METKEIVGLLILSIFIPIFVFWLMCIIYNWFVNNNSKSGFVAPKYNSPIDNPDIPRIRNKKNNIVGSDLKDPREVINQNLKQTNPIKTSNFILNKSNPLGLNIQESMIYNRI